MTTSRSSTPAKAPGRSVKALRGRGAGSEPSGGRTHFSAQHGYVCIPRAADGREAWPISAVGHGGGEYKRHLAGRVGGRLGRLGSSRQVQGRFQHLYVGEGWEQVGRERLQAQRAQEAASSNRMFTQATLPECSTAGKGSLPRQPRAQNPR